MKKLLLLPGLILGVAVFWYMSQSKIGPEKTQIQERAKPVRVIPAPKVILIPIAVGNGYVQPERAWKAVAEVAGRIVDFNPDLQQGAFVAKGDLLISIAPEQSQLALQEIQAEIQKIQAQIEELDQKKADTQRQLEVEKRSLAIYKNELERKQKLFEGGIISRSDLNREEQNLLTQKNTVENYKGILNQLPSERRALKASLRALKTRSQDARITLKKTVIKAPFDSRLVTVDAKQPDSWPLWLFKLLFKIKKPLGLSIEFFAHHPWEAVKHHFQETAFEERYGGWVHFSTGFNPSL